MNKSWTDDQTPSMAGIDADFAALKAHGVDSEEIWDIAAMAVSFAMSTWLANVFGIPPKDEFMRWGGARA